jgi:hypothetical protein
MELEPHLAVSTPTHPGVHAEIGEPSYHQHRGPREGSKWLSGLDQRFAETVALSSAQPVNEHRPVA